MAEFSKYIGMDVHKETIAVAVAEGAGGAVRYLGEVPNNAEAVRRLLKRLAGEGGRLRFCYEAGPCGYGLYRRLAAAGHACAVVAPALIPRKSGERVKTDRCDALNLARLDRGLDTVESQDQRSRGRRPKSRRRQTCIRIRRVIGTESNFILAPFAITKPPVRPKCAFVPPC